MKTETKGKRNGIQWKILTQLDDLDFADDLALMSHSHWQMQDKTTDLARISAQVGMKINKKKTKIMRLNTTCVRPIMLAGEGLEEVESFRYLGSTVDTRGGTEADVKTRISKASKRIQSRNVHVVPGNFILKANSATTSDTTTTLLAITE